MSRPPVSSLATIGKPCGNTYKPQAYLEHNKHSNPCHYTRAGSGVYLKYLYRALAGAISATSRLSLRVRACRVSLVRVYKLRLAAFSHSSVAPTKGLTLSPMGVSQRCLCVQNQLWIDGVKTILNALFSSVTCFNTNSPHLNYCARTLVMLGAVDNFAEIPA